MTNQDKVQKSIDLVKKFCPNYKVTYKKDSWVHRVIGWILSKVGNPYYMTDFITTLGQNTALPSKSDIFPDLWVDILHEGQHGKDASKIGNLIFAVSYLLPQLIGILGVLYTLTIAIVLLCGGPLALLWGLIALIFIAPLPAFGRAYAEVRGYTVSLAAAFWGNTIGNEEKYIDFIVSMFTGFSYYYMWPFESWVRAYFELKLLELQTGQFALDPYLAACKVLSREIASG